MSDRVEGPHFASVAWEGDSCEILQSFPSDVRQNLGFQLWLLLQGEEPSDYRPLSSIGPGVFELRDQDARGWYRLIYLSPRNDVSYVRHSFEKKGRQMPRRDSETAKRRLKAVKARLLEGIE